MIDALDQRGDANGVVAVSRREFEAHEIAQGIGQRLGRSVIGNRKI